MNVATKIIDKILHSARMVDEACDFTDSFRNSEKCFSDTLCDVLRASTIDVDREVSYTNKPRKKCDIFATIHGRRVYLEAKLLYPAYWKKGVRYKQRLFDPLLIFGKTRESHSAARDLEKLATLQLDRPDYLGVIIVASCTRSYDSKDEFLTFARLARIDTSPWIHRSLEFSNSFHRAFHFDARVWLISSADIGGWWQSVRQLFAT